MLLLKYSSSSIYSASEFPEALMVTTADLLKESWAKFLMEKFDPPMLIYIAELLKPAALKLEDGVLADPKAEYLFYPPMDIFMEESICWCYGILNEDCMLGVLAIIDGAWTLI